MSKGINVDINKLQSHMISMLIKSINRDIPMSVTQDYWRWSLSNQNPNQDFWIKTLGIPQFTNLTFVLLQDFLLNYKGILEYSSALNIYFLFEIISDNLAIGCVDRFNQSSELSDLRREVITQYNVAVVQKLENPQLSVEALLEPIKDQVAQLSLFEHSLSAENFRELTSNYVNVTDSVSSKDIEFGAWSLLVANIKTASLMLEQFSGDATYTLLQESLIRRYKDMNHLMNTVQYDLQDRLDYGISTILASAALAYYFAAFNRLSSKKFIISEQTLAVLNEVFDGVSLLIRLLNDVGPRLLNDKTLIDEFIMALEACKNQSNDAQSIFDLLLTITENNPEMTRINKDLQFNEYNILLDGLDNLNLDEAIKQSKYILTELSKLYAEHEAKLKSNLALLDELLGSDSFGKLVSGFVNFHVYLYQSPHHLNSGEYSV